MTYRIEDLGPQEPGEVITEFVGGSLDGELRYVPLVVRVGEALTDASMPASIRGSGVTGELYRRRGQAPDLCPAHRMVLWHYDVTPSREPLPRPPRRSD